MEEDKYDVLEKDSVSPFWSQFDMILCIEQHSDHRKNKPNELFSRLGIVVQYVPQKNQSGNADIRRFAAHQLCMKMAYDASCQNVVIFEEDIEFLNAVSQKHYDDITHFIQENKTWDIFSFGAFPNICFDTATKFSGAVFKVQTQSTHAYVASRTWMQKMLRINYHFLECSLDRIYAQNKNSFCVFPTLFYQIQWSASESVQFTPIVSKLIIEFKNRYAQYVPVPVVYVILALVVILCIMLYVISFRCR